MASMVLVIGAQDTVELRRRVGNVFGHRVLTADGGDANIGCFAGFGECVIARVKVLALLEFVLKEVLLVGHLAIEAKETLLIGGELADVDFVLLVGIHAVDFSRDLLSGRYEGMSILAGALGNRS